MTFSQQVPTLLNSLGLNSGLIINGLGDSMTADGSVYQPSNASLATVPAWVASTSYVASNSVVQNGGLPYICTTSGISASSGGPTGQGSNITDGAAHWAFRYPQQLKIGRGWLPWVEMWSGGRVSFRLSDGYAGLVQSLLKIVVVNGGSNYSGSDTLTLTTGSGQGGATATLTVVSGVITAVTVTSPGQNANSGDGINYTINTSAGSGAVLSIVGQPSGTFATQGAWTQDVIQFTNDAIKSSVDIFVVMTGTNDVFNYVTLGTPQQAYSTIIANLRTIWETLLAANKRVIISPVMPISSSTTTIKEALRQRVNKFIRAYYRKESWANPLGVNVGMADATGFWTNGASTTNGVIGTTTGVYPAVTVDGLHPSTRGAQFVAWEILQSLQRDLGIAVFDYPSRVYSQFDGQDNTFNPGGNYLEGIPWQASTAYVIGQQCSNDTAPIKTYYCTTAGTSAGSGGPTGTGTAITDGGVTWHYGGRPAGMSVFNSGTNGIQAAKTGITYSGNLAGGWTITRTSGTGAGTITQSIESPWSNGQAGQRQVTSFNLGSGDNTEIWSIFIAPTCLQLGLTASDFGTTQIYGECELELSAISRVTALYFAMLDTASNAQTETGANQIVVGGTTQFTNSEILYSAGEQISYPNNGKLLLRTEPLLLPSWFTTSTQININWYIGFDCSGGAGTATATIKHNYIGVKKFGVA